MPFGLRQWMRLVLPMQARKRSFSAERQALSAHTSDAVLFWSINPSRRRAPSWAAASVTLPRRMMPCRRSIAMCDL